MPKFKANFEEVSIHDNFFWADHRETIELYQFVFDSMAVGERVSEDDQFFIMKLFQGQTKTKTRWT